MSFFRIRHLDLIKFGGFNIIEQMFNVSGWIPASVINAADSRSVETAVVTAEKKT